MSDECLTDIQLECPLGFQVEDKNYVSTEDPEYPLGLDMLTLTTSIKTPHPACQAHYKMQTNAS